MFGKTSPRQPIDDATIVVVSGLPRSGTSMLMGMLEAGGIEVFGDGRREADEDNPLGYYEHELVKRLAEDGDKRWVGQARGRALKVVSYLLTHLPTEHRYQVVFVERDLNEVLASQNKMLHRLGKRAGPTDQDQRLRQAFAKHLDGVKEWLSRQTNFETLFVGHRRVIEDPLGEADRIARFLGVKGDLAERMAQAVDKRLYRNRA